jgi:hypothetical protein
VAFQRVPQAHRRVDPVDVAATISNVGQIARIFELSEDSLNSPAGDAHSSCDVSDASVLILLETDQHVGVIRQKRPLRPLGFFREAGRIGGERWFPRNHG